MSIIDTLITDRTQADVARVAELKAKWVNSQWTGTTAELAEWYAGMKGAYNATDLNRVTEAMEYLAGAFEGLGYPVPGYTGLGITWTTENIPSPAQMSQYLANVQALMGVLATVQYTVDLPQSMAFLTYVGANNIEQILFEINAYLEAMQAVFLRASMPWAYAGAGYYFPDLWLYLYTSDGLLVVTEDDMAVQVR